MVLECLWHVNLAGRKGVCRGTETVLEAFWNLLGGLCRSRGISWRSRGGIFGFKLKHFWGYLKHAATCDEHHLLFNNFLVDPLLANVLKGFGMIWVLSWGWFGDELPKHFLRLSWKALRFSGDRLASVLGSSWGVWIATSVDFKVMSMFSQLTSYFFVKFKLVFVSHLLRKRF